MDPPPGIKAVPLSNAAQSESRLPESPALAWSTPIQFVPGVGADRREYFHRLGVRTAGQSLFLFPRAYEQPAIETPVPQMREGQAASMIGQITEVEISGRSSGKSVLGVLVENDSGAVRLLFFNQPFRAESLRRGTRVVVSGIPRLAGFRIEFVHPKVTLLADDEALPTSRILPIYPLVEGLKQSTIRRVMSCTVESLAGQVEEVFNDSLRAQFGARLEGKLPPIANSLMTISESLQEIHQPSSRSWLEGW